MKKKISDKEIIKKLKEEIVNLNRELKLVQESDYAKFEVNRDLTRAISEVENFLGLSRTGLSSQIINELRFKDATRTHFEGEISQVLDSLRAENMKLWYMMRVNVGDETVKDQKIKPGEMDDVSIRRIRTVF
jgi:hypothetical protein